MRLYLTISLFGLICIAAHANVIDSLHTVLARRNIYDTTRVVTLVQLAKNYRNIDTKLAEQYGFEGLKLAQKLNFANGVASASDVLGVVFVNKADYRNALYYLLTALQLNENSANERAYAGTCNNLGSVYYHLKKYDQAAVYYERSLKLKLKLGNKKDASSTYSNLGNIYMKKNNLDLCIKYYQKALENATLYADTYNVSISLMNIGEAYYDKKEYKKALKYYNKALLVNENRNDQFHLANINFAIGKILLKQNELQSSEPYLHKALQISTESGARHVRLNILKELSDLYEKRKEYQRMIKYYKIFHTLSDSIYNTETEKQINDVLAKYETEKKDKKIALLEKDKALSEGSLQRATLLRNVFIAGFILITISAIILARNVILKQRVNKILKEKNQKIESQQVEIERKNNELMSYNAELMRENVSTKYEVLKAKVNPHFLFNSLNTLSGLIIAEPNQAVRYITRFSKLYRKILELGNHQLISIDDEMDFVYEYMYLQQVRFKENLVFEVTQHDSNSGLIPPFCIQLLVENALKHNVVSKRHPLLIKIEIGKEEIVVSNSLMTKIHDEHSTGIGQRNISDRYKLVTDLRPRFEMGISQYIVHLPIIKA